MARDLRLFYLFRLLSTSYLFVPCSVAFAVAKGCGLDQVMMLNAIFCLVAILAEVPTGALADRIGRRPAMAAGALAMVAACIAWVNADSFLGLALAEALAALSMTLCSGADSAYLFDLLDDHGRGAEYERREGTATAWHLLGSALAFAVGGLLGARNLAFPYVATGIVAGGAFLVALFMREDRPAPLHAPMSRLYIEHIRASLQTVTARRRLLWAIGYSAIVFVLLGASRYIYQPYLKIAGFSIAETGFIFAGVFLVAAAVAHHADSLRRLCDDRVLVWGLLVTLCVTFPILASVRGPWTLVVLVIQACANGLFSPLVKPLLNRQIEDSRRRATVLSMESIVRRAAFLVFSLGVGLLMGRHGATSGLLLCGVVGLIGLAILGATHKSAPLVPARDDEVLAPDAAQPPPAAAPVDRELRAG